MRREAFSVLRQIFCLLRGDFNATYRISVATESPCHSNTEPTQARTGFHAPLTLAGMTMGPGS